MVSNDKFLKIRLDWGEYITYQIFDSQERGCVSVSNYEDETWIHGLYVVEKYRNKGIATRLLDMAENYAQRKIHVSTVENAPRWLIDFYNKRGYAVDNCDS